MYPNIVLRLLFVYLFLFSFYPLHKCVVPYLNFVNSVLFNYVHKRDKLIIYLDDKVKDLSHFKGKSTIINNIFNLICLFSFSVYEIILLEN